MQISFSVPVLIAIGFGGFLVYLVLALRGGSRSKNLPPGEVSFLSSFVAPSAVPAAFRKMRADTRGVFRFMLFGKNMVVINDADVARTITSKDGDVLTSSWPATTQELLGPKSFSTTHGPYHRYVRKLLAQGFSSQAIESYLPWIQRLVDHRLAVWAKEDSVKMQNQARLLAFEVMAVVVAGLQLEERKLVELSTQFDTFTKGFFFVWHLNLPWTAFGKAKRARAAIVAALEKQLELVAAQRQQGQEQVDERHGFLMAKLAAAIDKNGQPLSRKELQDIGVTLLFAGHETTGMTFTILLMLLLDRPDVWERLREEQHQVVAALGEAITGEAVREMKYLDAVVKEGWRWHPLVGSVPRCVLRDAEVGGYTVPKGWQAMINLATMLRADGAARWGTGDNLGPKDFNPDRWLGPQGGGLGVLPGANAFIFGIGNRSCLGAPLAWAEIKVIMATLARKYQVVNALDHPPAWTEAPLTFEGQLPVHILPLGA